LSEGPAGPDQLFAFIQLKSAEMSGVLVLSASPDILWQTYPGDPGAAPETERLPDEELQKWLCELTNQLLGLLKTRLRPCGVRLVGTLPLCLLQMDLPAERETFGPLAFSFRSGADLVYVQLDATVRPDIRLDRAQIGLICLPPEGHGADLFTKGNPPRDLSEGEAVLF
jgi:hypothetical protein